MPTNLTISFDLARDLAILQTPFSHAEFSDTETGRAMLFRAIRANAQYIANRARRIDMGDTTVGKDVSEAILAYDAAEIAKLTRRYNERGKIVLTMDELEIEI